MIPKQKPKGLVSYPIFMGFGYTFGFHTHFFGVLGMGLGFIPKFFGFHGFGFGFHTQIFWVLGMGFGCGYESQTQNRNPNFFGCECMFVEN